MKIKKTQNATLPNVRWMQLKQENSLPTARTACDTTVSCIAVWDCCWSPSSGNKQSSSYVVPMEPICLALLPHFKNASQKTRSPTRAMALTAHMHRSTLSNPMLSWTYQAPHLLVIGCDFAKHVHIKAPPFFAPNLMLACTFITDKFVVQNHGLAIIIAKFLTLCNKTTTCHAYRTTTALLPKLHCCLAHQWKTDACETDQYPPCSQDWRFFKINIQFNKSMKLQTTPALKTIC